MLMGMYRFMYHFSYTEIKVFLCYLQKASKSLLLTQPRNNAKISELNLYFVFI